MNICALVLSSCVGNMENLTGSITCTEERPIPDFSQALVITQVIAFGVLHLVIIVGNSLVIIAVFTTQRLRTVTNMFIASLAVADLALAAAVLPFSSTKQVLSYWPFGVIWCKMWLAIDVWICTASILNLVAISLDRFLAISKPFKYHSLLSPRRARLLIAAVWVFSFLICSPPLIGWNSERKFIAESLSLECEQPNYANGFSASNTSSLSANSTYVVMASTVGTDFLNTYFNDSSSEKNATNSSICCVSNPECHLTSDPGYVVYSAVGSFYLPMVIMILFYWRIYRTAVNATTVLKRGVLTTKSGGDLSPANPEKTVTLRVHRGGQSIRQSQYNKPSEASRKTSNEQQHERSRHTSQSEPDSMATSLRRPPADDSGPTTINGESHLSPQSSQHSSLMWDNESNRSRKSCCELKNLTANWHQRCKAQNKEFNRCSSSAFSEEVRETPVIDRRSGTASDKVVPTTSMLKQGKRNIHTQLKKLSRETKAAKTVGIIVGCFIFCWLPFFTVYLISGFCPDCTPNPVFMTFFWLGYCNSALNPCIYALFSRDFRFAFKRILCCGRRAQMREAWAKTRHFTLESQIYASAKESDSTSDISKRLVLEDGGIHQESGPRN